MNSATGFLAAWLACAIAGGSFADETRDATFPEHRFVTSHPDAQDMWPCFSPDNRTLLFTRTTDQKTWRLMTVSVDGGEPQPFPQESPALGTRANWSAKHNLIAFNGQPPTGQFNLTLIKGDGSGMRVLRADGLSDQMSYPSWYPDGKSFAVVDFSLEQGSAIKRIDIEAGTVVTLTDPKTHWAGVPRVSPDGNFIVMCGQVQRGQRYSQYQNQIWFLNREGELRPLDSKRGWAPYWSPDGKWIVFASDRGSDSGQWSIFIASPDGATVRQLTPAELNAGHPTWSPDGKRIAFFAQPSADKKARGLAVVDAAAAVVALSDARAADPYIECTTYTYKTVGDLPIKADVYRLPGDDVRPVIVWIHGGGLITGGRGGPALEQRMRYLDAGYVIVSIDYRLAPETKAAGIVEDVRDAIQWVRGKGPELFKIDSKRVAVVGHSAGGYLTLVAGFAVEPRPQALVAFYGYGDVDGDWYAKPHEIYRQTRPLFTKDEAHQAIGTKETTNGAKGRGNFYTYCRQNGLWPKEVVGFDPVTQPLEFDRFCPVRNVTKDYPPTLLLHGDQDIDVPHEQSVAMAAELKRVGVVHEFVSIKGGGHGFDGKGLSDPDVSAAFDKIEMFLKQHVLDKKGKSDLPRLPRDNLLVFRDTDGGPAPVKSVEDWAKRRAEVVRGMEAVMGQFPGEAKRCALDMKVEEEVDGDTYVRRLITYASEPGGRVPAYLLIPKDVLAGTKKAPAVLCLHGTNKEIGHGTVIGLGTTPNRGYALELTQRGYVTLSPSYPLLANYQPDLKMLGWESGTLKAVWDNMRGLDLLASLPYVDHSRGFGVVGQSLGGHNSVFTAVFDDRLTAVVSSCGLDSFSDYMKGDPKWWEPESGWCQTRYMPKLAEYKGRLADIPFDFHEMVGALSPRHVLIAAPKMDTNFRMDSVDRIAAAARPIFKLHGQEDRLRVEHPDCGHDFPPEMREAAYKLFDSVLGGK